MNFVSKDIVDAFFIKGTFTFSFVKQNITKYIIVIVYVIGNINDDIDVII